MKQISLTFIILISISILKSVIGYNLIRANIGNVNNLILSIVQFGLTLGIIGTMLYFFLLSYLTYGITTLWSGNFDISFNSFISAWFNVGFLPMLIISLLQLLLFDFFFYSVSDVSDNIIFINTLTEIFFFLFGIFTIKNKFKTNYFIASTSIILPIFLFQLLKTIL